MFLGLYLNELGLNQMSLEALDQHVKLSLQRFEELWQRADELPKPTEGLWRQADEFPEQQQELLMESLTELSSSLEELQVVAEELRQQNLELTRRKQAVEAERQRYQNLIHLAPDCYLVTTKEGNIVEANQKAGQLFGIAPKYLINKPIAVFTAIEEHRELYRQFNQLKEGGAANCQLRFVRRDNSAFEAACTVIPIEDKQDEVLLRWHLQALASQPDTEERLFRHLFEEAATGIAVLDTQGRVIKSNRTLEAMLGRTQQQLLAELPQLLNLNEGGIETELFQQLIARQRYSYQVEKRINFKAATEWLRLTVALVPGTDSHDLVTCTLEEITKQRHWELKQLEANKTPVPPGDAQSETAAPQASLLQSQMLAIAAHEIRNPISNIRSCVELIERNHRQELDSETSAHLQRITLNASQAVQIADNLLLIGRIEAKKPLRIAAIDYTQFCHQLVEELQQEANQIQISFACQEQYVGLCDAALLRCILTNLLHNAIKYSPAGSEVSLKIAKTGEQLAFRIQDQGIGIPQPDQKQLFKAYFRGSNVKGIAGNGLGLAVVKQSVDLLMGVIDLESQVECGTTFTVTIPINQPRRVT